MRARIEIGGELAALQVAGQFFASDQDRATALNAERLSIISDSIDRIVAVVDQVYLPDLLAIAPYYLDYAAIGEGLGNFLTWGELPGEDNSDTSKYVVPRALILNRDLAHVTVPDPRDFDHMKEYVSHSWYKYGSGDDAGLHPWQGETTFNYTGPKPPYQHLEVDQKYSWLKAPRWNDVPVEVGPLARVLKVSSEKMRDKVFESLEQYMTTLSEQSRTRTTYSAIRAWLYVI